MRHLLLSLISQRSEEVCRSSELRLLNEVSACLREGEHLSGVCGQVFFFLSSLNLSCVFLHPFIFKGAKAGALLPLIVFDILTCHSTIKDQHKPIGKHFLDKYKYPL